MQLKVSKFGGSSLADAAQFKKVYDIVMSDPSRRFIVPSAPGKRFSKDKKVTDMLYECYKTASSGGSIDALFAEITSRYNEIIAGLELKLDLTREFERIKGSFYVNAGRDYAASRGEYLNGKILAAYLGYDFIDAGDVVFFRFDGSFDDEKTYSVMSKTLSEHRCAVIPGFYGSMPNDTIKTFSRGGSDITGSIVARAAGAELYENWTDVSGFLMADPRIISSPKVIDYITYHELRELSYMGATVLHEDAVFPVRKVGIPINIRNTNAPDEPGTMIVTEIPEGNSIGNITGIAGKKGFSAVNIEKDMMNNELGFGRRVLYAFEKNGISFEHLPSGIDTMSIIVSTAAIEDKKQQLMRDICEIVNPDHITIETGLALVAVVGRGMVRTKGTASRIFTAVYKNNVNIKMIDQGSSELNIILGVNEDDFETAMRSIYEEFAKE
ncbi:MAG: aspartate kinase [Oscillospiraceae bacterium]|nr:aspartate kinase [Oscillospiraceae bacterium]